MFECKYLINELLKFMKDHKIKTLFLCDYVVWTQDEKKWNSNTVATLHKAVNQSKALEMSYMQRDGVACKIVRRRRIS